MNQKQKTLQLKRSSSRQKGKTKRQLNVRLNSLPSRQTDQLLLCPITRQNFRVSLSRQPLDESTLSLSPKIDSPKPLKQFCIRKLNDHFKYKPSSFSPRSLKKDIVEQIVELLLQSALDDYHISHFFFMINRQRYCIQFKEYLLLLLRDEVFLRADQLRRVHSFGLESRFYMVFKKILFKIIYFVQNQSVDIFTFFEGCQRVEKFRVSIATLNDLYLITPKHTLILHLSSVLALPLPLSDKVLDNVVQYLVNNVKMMQTVWSLQRRPQFLTMSNFLRLKIFCVQITEQAQQSINYFFYYFENLMKIRYLFLQQQSLFNYVSVNFQKFNLFINLLDKNLQASSTLRIHPRLKKASQLLLCQLFDDSDIGFFDQQIACILSEIPEANFFFIDQLFGMLQSQLGKMMFQKQIINYMVARANLLRRRSTCINDYQINPLLKTFSSTLQDISHAFPRLTRFRRCSSLAIALSAIKQHVFELQQIREVHKQLRLSSEQVAWFVSRSCKVHRAEHEREKEVFMIEKLFEKLQDYLVSS